MTIKEIEALSGMTRANIRFYEAQGLIAPLRGENGYRDYSEDDLNELLRIKLLRSMDLPLEDIRGLRDGQTRLGEILDEHLLRMEKESLRLENVQELCMRMRRDGVSYEGLDARSYLDIFELKNAEADALPRLRAPIRRFFARTLDLTAYGLVWNFCLWLFTGIDLMEQSMGWEFAGAAITLAMMLFIEPLMLSLFGTTPGKALLGLYVSDPDGGRMKYSAALERTANVITFGLGFNVPLLDIWCKWRSYKRCEAGQELEWENDSIMSLREDKGLQVVGWLLVWIMLLAADGTLMYTQSIPRNTGELTIEEFAENFNYVAQRKNYAPDFRLDPNGSWIEYGGTVINLMGVYESPEFCYTTDERGNITAITMEKEYRDISGFLPNIDSEMALAIQAFVRPQNGFIHFGDKTAQVLELLDRSTWQNWGAQCNGVQITSRTEHEGYDIMGGLVVPIEGQEQSCRLFFEMKLTN